MSDSQSIALNVEAPDERLTWFADIILPVPLPRMFTYRIPRTMEEIVQIGSRVIVQFGSKRVLTGVVGKLHNDPPKKYNARYILEVLDENPIVEPVQIKLFDWIADYYVCTVGEVLNIALPSGLKLSSESKAQLNPDFFSEDHSLEEMAVEFSEKEKLVLEALKEKSSLTYNEIGELLQEKSFYNTIKSLIAKEAILIYEEVKEKYKPKVIKKLRLASAYAQHPDKLEELFTLLEKRAKQLDVVMAYMHAVPQYRSAKENKAGIAKSQLMDRNLSTSSVNTLVKNGIFEEFEEVVSRFEATSPTQERVFLTDYQQQARQEILHQFQTKDTVLLHGITGSGKTEIYIDLIQEVLNAGGQVLYLLPEIALTTQIVLRLKKIFGDRMGIYHSRFSDNERVEVWQGILAGDYPLVVGVRSAVLLPFDNLSLIIVDEEHETSYKQFDPAPRYHARDVALMLARLHHSKTLLGSATPSIESYYHASHAKYGLVTLNKRYGNAQLPNIELVDIKAERKQKTMKEDFTSGLLDAMQAVLDNKEQAIIFQNRRGYAPYLHCEDCAHIPKCQNCDVSLTYHQYARELRCHYCGHHEGVHQECEACGSTRIRTAGFGTEKLEEEIQTLLPQSRVQRMDLDTTRKKNSYEQIIESFAGRELDFLVGTQMVSKGLDFDGVSLVGILDADRMIHFPDFRSHERTFQLITQVSGRSGRRDKVGRVIIQTTNLKQPILHKIIANDYLGLFEEEIHEREVYNYPPFVRVIRLTVKNPDKRTVDLAAAHLAHILKDRIGSSRVLGPEEPLISRLRNQYLIQLVIKLEKHLQLRAIKTILRDESVKLCKEKAFKKTNVVIDVDPY
uniref:Replication restart protein PriA n=1 Tax=Roseihalotalea indica TaxID=2867963 RepID=A0AA49GHV0_9BACT|nr:primosomal protein N' [Tunicatimonas sp. TK19036]